MGVVFTTHADSEKLVEVQMRPHIRPRPHSNSARFVPLLLGVLLAAPLQGQADALRVGISLGGISTVGLVLEYEDGQGSTELTIGTWSFRDLSASLVRKQRFGTSQVRPTMGLGLWAIVAFPDEERMGAALVVRAPIGAEWDIDSGATNFLTLDLNVNRAIWVRRTDPEDDTPLNRRLVPLPGVSYRWRNR